MFLNKLYLGDKIKKNEIGWACGTCGDGRDVYGVLVGETVMKITLGIFRGRRKNKIRKGFQEIGLGRRMDLFGSGKGCASYILDAVSSIQFSLLLRCDVLSLFNWLSDFLNKPAHLSSRSEIFINISTAWCDTTRLSRSPLR